MAASRYSDNVFVNCPFDQAYHPLFRAIVFAVFDCGFVARCALEIDDSSQVRIEKIARIIAESKFGIHDVSRTDLDGKTGLPRFNMPLELGMFLGAKRFGRDRHRTKACLILDKEPYRYQAFMSDIAGQDIRSHGDQAGEGDQAGPELAEGLFAAQDHPGGQGDQAAVRAVPRATAGYVHGAEDRGRRTDLQ